MYTHSPVARRGTVRHAAVDRYLLQQRVCCCGPVLGQTDRRTDSANNNRRFAQDNVAVGDWQEETEG